MKTKRFFQSIHPIRKVVFAAVILVSLQAAAGDPKDVSIIDARHYSHVFGEIRNFRVFLPPGYSNNTTRRYPVIYFFHGWSQRYFGSSNPYGDFDKGDDNGGDNIANFVADHDVLVVKPDGYNRSPGEPYYVRPYNVSPVETHRQFPLYFPELVDHIDAQFRTIADREHRGISGLSMGGFMSFWIGGKYPHLLSAVGNFCGSPEFFVGPKDFPVELRHMDMYNNYGGMQVRLHYGDKDFIRGYHEDLNSVWTQVMDHYDYKIFDAAHATCGMREMLTFILRTFENPSARPPKWAHTDVYPSFSTWDYEISTDRTMPGFTVLEKVDARGFRLSVREFLPDGPLLPSVNVTVRTAPIYEQGLAYTIHDIDTKTGTSSVETITADGDGRLTLHLTGAAHEVGINRKHDKPNLSVAAVNLSAGRWASQGKPTSLRLTIINKGATPARGIRATLSPMRPVAVIEQDNVTIRDLDPNEMTSGETPFSFVVDADSIRIIRFKLTLRDARRNEWVEHFEVPIEKGASEIKNFQIADGRAFTVANAGTDTVTMMLGQGNGDGIANPGESIVIVVRDQDKWWRTDVTGVDPYVNPFGVNVRKSDNWTPFDHVGGSSKYDIPLIASDCPEGYPLEFLVKYWLPEYPLHIIRQGTVKFQVKGQDTTAPVIGEVFVTGDNVLQAKVYDGGKIKRVTAQLVEEKEDGKSIELVLTDDGRNGDRANGDLFFSAIIPQQVFGIFRAVIQAEDALGNKAEFKNEEKFVVN